MSNHWDVRARRWQEANPGFPSHPPPTWSSRMKMVILSFFPRATAQESQCPTQSPPLPQSWGGSSAGPAWEVGERWRHHWDGVSKLSLGTDRAQENHQLHMHRLCFNWLGVTTFNRDKPNTSLNSGTRDPILFGFTKPVRILVMHEKNIYFY